MNKNTKQWLKLILPKRKHCNKAFSTSDKRKEEQDDSLREEQCYLNGKLNEHIDIIMNLKINS